MTDYRTDYKYCAGVLPFTRYNSSIYFLLGKSRRNNRLITFSGKNDVLDRSELETAARECYEETLGAVMDRSSWLDRIKKCDDASILRSHTPRGMPCHTFVVEIPYRRLYTLVFSKTKDFLVSCNVRSHALLEMTDIKFICARSMLTKVRRQWEKNGVLTDPTQWEKLNRISNISTEELVWRRNITDDELDEHEDDCLEIKFNWDRTTAIVAAMMRVIVVLLLCIGVSAVLARLFRLTPQVNPIMKPPPPPSEPVVVHAPATVEATESVRQEADLLAQFAIPVQYVDNSLLSKIPDKLDGWTTPASDSVSVSNDSNTPDPATSTVHSFHSTHAVHTGARLDHVMDDDWQPALVEDLSFPLVDVQMTSEDDVAPFNDIEGSAAMLSESPSEVMTV
jgi:hypothetical protein